MVQCNDLPQCGRSQLRFDHRRDRHCDSVIEELLLTQHDTNTGIRNAHANYKQPFHQPVSYSGRTFVLYGTGRRKCLRFICFYETAEAPVLTRKPLEAMKQAGNLTSIQECSIEFSQQKVTQGPTDFNATRMKLWDDGRWQVVDDVANLSNTTSLDNSVGYSFKFLSGAN
jgi:hypothetical protein